MKKVIFAGFIVFLAVFLATCGDFSQPESQKAEIVGYTADGRPLVNLSIDTGGTNRSLTDGLAKAGTNYIEVIFCDTAVSPIKYYRTSGYKGLTIKLAVPAGNYGSGNAIMLAGRNNDKTLLATGVITATIEESAPLTPIPGAVINSDTISVTFTLTSLTAALNADATSPSFVITDLGSTYGTGGDFDVAPNDNTFKGRYDDKPCFQLPTDDSEIEAELTIGGFSATGSKIYIKGTSSTTINNLGGGTKSLGGNITNANNTLVGTGVFNFDLTTSTNPATDVMFFSVPVVGMSTTDIPGVITWFIRGGLDTESEDFDGGNSAGIVISVADTPAQLGATVTIETD